MATAIAPRRSLDVESSRLRSTEAQNGPVPRTFRKMFQETLRVTGLSRQRNNELDASSSRPVVAQPVATDSNKENVKEKQKPKDEAKRGLKATFTRKPKVSNSGGTDKATSQEETRAAMGSLRQASMSSPVLPMFSNPFTMPSEPHSLHSPTSAVINPPGRQRSSTRSSANRDGDRAPVTPLQISKPRALGPSLPSSPTSASPSSHRNRSPQPPQLTRFPSISTSNIPSTSHQYRGVSPSGYHSRNTSTTSLAAPSPYRELIRTASSLLIKHLSRPPPPLKPSDWQDVEVRLRALSRLERIWGKSGGGSSTTALGSGAGFGGGEERERRLFCEAVRDGYVLCALINKFRPGTVARPDPKEDGFTKTSNITKFLAGALYYGISSQDLFLRDDMLEASSESMARVAQTIVALVKLGEPVLPSLGGSQGPYMSIRDGSLSSPNLLDSSIRNSRTRANSRTRYSPPSNLPPVPGSSSGKPTTPASIDSRQTQSRPINDRVVDLSSDPFTFTHSAPQPPPRSPHRMPLSPRASVSSSLTDSTAGFSLSDNRASTRFGTVRTVTTMATSIVPSETASINGARQESKNGHQESFDDPLPPASTYQTQFTEIPTTTRRRSYDRDASAARLAALSQSPTSETTPARPWRERRSSELPSADLSNVEEVDENGTRRGRPVREVAPLMTALDPTPAPPPAVPPRRISLDRPRVSFEENPLKPVDLTSSPPRPKAGLPFRRPLHGHRHSVDTVATTTMLLPIPRNASLSKDRDRQPSPSPSRESTTPSPPTGGLRPALSPRRTSSRASPRASYVPKLNGVDDARRKHSGESDQIEPTSMAPAVPRVPFPRSTSGDFALSGSGMSVTSRSAALPDTVAEEHRINNVDGMPRRASGGGPVRPVLPRGRYNSEQDTVGTRARKPRPTSLDDGGAHPGRSRFESMVNMGASGDALSRESSMSFNAIRQPLIVREEGKPPMHYRIGNGIGRGQFGAVYRALNLNTGQMVAVKRISLHGLSEEEISSLMKEVDVLKRLSHPSIVKYEGMVRSTDTLSIVLEYVENGSLGQILKAFGKLNERLVAGYVIKILEGLDYLHKSHVVHCDLKAANILTTKNGNVKLSDFGVSLNLNAKVIEEIRNDVAGTPNWMAPEVIELKGASTASDIWSLGCTAIELLTGHPPYHEISNGLSGKISSSRGDRANPRSDCSVMFRIVEDTSPPIPDICSSLMKDFLRQCFEKDPLKRPSAEMLFDHAWLHEHKPPDLHRKDSMPRLNDLSPRSTSLDIRPIPMSESPQPGLSPLNISITAPQFHMGVPITPISPDSAEGATRQHSFIKTTFARAVLCRVCHQSVKRSAVLCDECGLIAHSRCAADAPPSCDIRTQLLLYTQYSHASNSQELSTPTRESGTPASSPIAIPNSPGLRPRARRQSDATFSSSPKLSDRIMAWRKSNKSPEPASPPLPAIPAPTSYRAPREEATTPTPARTPSNGPLSPILVPPGPPEKSPEKLHKRSRLSVHSAANTDSMRSMVTAAETVSSSTPSYDSTPRSSVAHNIRRPRGAAAITVMTPVVDTNAADRSTQSNTRRSVTRMSAVSSNASEFGEERKRIRRTRRDSVSSKDSQCIIV
ncbi:hypothetical protein FRC17_010501 [Serendipita sp. 399]|nr:hypothetical protein FRC17_010501 [Serendipita sp. 399]